MGRLGQASSFYFFNMHDKNSADRLSAKLKEARYDRDHLERNYTRILNGLQEHEDGLLMQ